MKAADFFRMTYSDRNTDVLSMYLSQMKLSQRSSIAKQRDISARVGRLDAILGRYRTKYNAAITDDAKRALALKTLRDTYKQRNELMKAIRQTKTELLKAGLTEAQIQQGAKAQAITVEQMRQGIKKAIEKDYSLSTTAKKAATKLDLSAGRQMTNRTSLMSLLEENSSLWGGLTDTNKKALGSLLLTKLTAQANKRKADGSEAPDERAIKAALRNVLNVEILTAKELKAAKTKDKIEGVAHLKKYKAGQMVPIGKEKKGLIQLSRDSQNELRKIQNRVRAAEKAAGSKTKEIKQVTALLSNQDLVAYLEDAKDYQIDGFYTDKNGQQQRYNQEAANDIRQQLVSIGQGDPTLVPLEKMQLLDRASYFQQEAERQALLAQQQSFETESMLPRMLSAPQFNLFTPIGQINNYIDKQKTGLHKNQMMAGFIAQEGTNAEFSALYNQAAPNQRIIFAVQPMVEDRLAQMSEGDDKAAQRLLTPKTSMEKKAAQYLQTESESLGTNLENLRAPEIVRQAEELSKRWYGGDREKRKAEFITYILTAQRLRNAGGYAYDEATKTEKGLNKVKKKAKETQQRDEKKQQKEVSSELSRQAKAAMDQIIKRDTKIWSKSKGYKGSTFQDIKLDGSASPKSYTWLGKTDSGKPVKKTFKIGDNPDLDKELYTAYGQPYPEHWKQ